MKSIDAGEMKIEGQPIIRPIAPAALANAINKQRQSSQETSLNQKELASLVLRPDVFVWVPDHIVPGLEIRCLNCSCRVTSAEWSRVRWAHVLSERMAYITKAYVCYNCGNDRRSRLDACLVESSEPHRTRKQRKTQADSNAFLAALPPQVRSLWPWRSTGQTLCDMEVVHFVRAFATRTSWSGIAQALNEMKENTWKRCVANVYSDLCKHYGLESVAEHVRYPAPLNVSADWVRNLYMSDWAERQPLITQELHSEIGDEVLVVDWTVDAAARSSSKYLFNVMDGRKTILLSALVTSCSPWAVQGQLAALQRRGVNPKVVYVDCDCCSAWRTIIKQIWENAIVKLDAMHAMRRVTRTLSSSQHPWHGDFCAGLSQAIFTYDQECMQRLRAARRRAGSSHNLPNNIKSKYVPRVITDGARIAQSVEAVLAKHNGEHPVAGALVTTDTKSAWQELRHHVVFGCLCDPPGMQMNVAGKSVVIGGETFRTIKTMRGASALEGFHTHQKQWLGHLARHAADAAGALLADGAARWNRKRKLERDARAGTPEKEREPQE
jgi:hypothetical protein